MRSSCARPTRAAAAALVVLALALAGCTSGAPDPDPAPTPTAAPGPQPGDIVATEVMVDHDVEIEVDVHPVVRAGDLAVLTLDLTPRGVAEGETANVYNWGGMMTENISVDQPAGVRLVDLRNDVIHHPGLDTDGDPVVAPDRWDRVPPEGHRVQIPYAAPAPDVTSVSLFLPGAPLVADVPVVEGDVPPVAGPAAEASAGPSVGSGASPAAPSLDLDAVVDARTFALDSASAELEGAVTTVESVERVDVQLGADVLFEFDAATLTPAATEALDLVAARIAEREPGTVEVVGHTDDQGDTAYNQDLSQRRAQAVADALAQRVDTSSYPLAADGRGEAEPFVPNDSEENRARNRRVAVSLTSVVTTRTDVTVTGELPPFGEQGLVGSGNATLLVEKQRPWEVTATARRVHGHVVVDLTVGADDDDAGSGWVLGSLRGLGSHRGMGAKGPWDVAGRASVLHGAAKLFPMDYATGPVEGYPDGEWIPVVDIAGVVGVPGGLSRVYSFVFPRLDVDTVTFQVGDGRSDDDFRLVDVPVEDVTPDPEDS